MKLSNFDYHLPENLIAQTPLEKRDSSKLFFYDKKNNSKQHKNFSEIIDLVDENSVLVFNKSRVIPARIKFKWENWWNREIFLSRKISKPGEKNIWECIVAPWAKFKEWRKYFLWWMKIFVEKVYPEKISWVREISFEFDEKKFNWEKKFLDEIKNFSEDEKFSYWLKKFWKIPSPAYIDQIFEEERYQTVFSENWNSVAAPTASLHFTEKLLEKLRQKWVQIEFVHLDVWIWTFLPVKTENILEHEMHFENFSIDKKTAENLNKAKKDWKKIIAVWTTSIRVLETIANKFWEMKEYSWDTDIFIYPWYKWKFIDEMVTNFHLPKSTLLMLVASFIWRNEIFEIYKEAIEKKYRFYSFWDSMYLRK